MKYYFRVVIITMLVFFTSEALADPYTRARIDRLKQYTGTQKRNYSGLGPGMRSVPSSALLGRSNFAAGAPRLELEGITKIPSFSWEELVRAGGKQYKSWSRDVQALPHEMYRRVLSGVFNVGDSLERRVLSKVNTTAKVLEDKAYRMASSLPIFRTSCVFLDGPACEATMGAVEEATEEVLARIAEETARALGGIHIPEIGIMHAHKKQAVQACLVMVNDSATVVAADTSGRSKAKIQSKIWDAGGVHQKSLERCFANRKEGSCWDRYVREDTGDVKRNATAFCGCCVDHSTLLSTSSNPEGENLCKKHIRSLKAAGKGSEFDQFSEDQLERMSSLMEVAFRINPEADEKEKEQLYAMLNFATAIFGDICQIGIGSSKEGSAGDSQVKLVYIPYKFDINQYVVMLREGVDCDHFAETCKDTPYKMPEVGIREALTKLIDWQHRGELQKCALGLESENPGSNGDPCENIDKYLAISSLGLVGDSLVPRDIASMVRVYYGLDQPPETTRGEDNASGEGMTNKGREFVFTFADVSAYRGALTAYVEAQDNVMTSVARINSASMSAKSKKLLLSMMNTVVGSANTLISMHGVTSRGLKEAVVNADHRLLESARTSTLGSVSASRSTNSLVSGVNTFGGNVAGAS